MECVFVVAVLSIPPSQISVAMQVFGTESVGVEMDTGEKRLNELGYKQELRREMVICMFGFDF